MQSIKTHYINKVCMWTFWSYCFLLMLAAFTIVPYVDSYYYWLLGQHLQMSYVDGPPLIAYVMRMFTILLGKNTFAINIVGTCTVALSFWIIIKIITLIISANNIDKNSAVSPKNTIFAVAVLWLVSYSIVAHRIVAAVTYDGLVNIFDLLLVFYALKYIKWQKPLDLYLIGIYAGLALLSKYTAVATLGCLILFFLSQKELRGVFKEWHIYLAGILTILIFSPVLIWNYQNHWASFIFQLHFHSHKLEVSPSRFGGVYYYLNAAVFATIFPNLVVLIAAKILNPKLKFVFAATTEKNRLLPIKLLLFMIGGVFGFWLFMSVSNDIPDRYLLLPESLFLVYTGMILLKNKNFKLFIILLVLNLGWSVGEIVQHSLSSHNLRCHQMYTQKGMLDFSSPLKYYIQIKAETKHSSNFCYTKVRQ